MTELKIKWNKADRRTGEVRNEKKVQKEGCEFSESLQP
jgi:hypothetical protein